MKPKRSELTSLLQHRFSGEVRRITPLPTNGPDRHWNFRVDAPRAHYLLRVQNPLAVAQREMHLEDEIKIIRYFAGYNLAPRLIASGRFESRRFALEEWLTGRPLPKRLARTHLVKLVEFLTAVNRVPYRPVAQLVRWKEDFLDVTERKKVIEARLRAGWHLPAFRPAIREVEPFVRAGLEKLGHEVARLPESAVRTPIFVYRDITPSNILLTEGGCKAVDWERHSVGLADPSFSVVVLYRRFRLPPADQAFVLQGYNRLRPTPRLRELVRLRNLERLLGEITWGFNWIARKKRLGFPRRTIRQEAAKTIRAAREGLKELQGILNS